MWWLWAAAPCHPVASVWKGDCHSAPRAPLYLRITGIPILFWIFLLSVKSILGFDFFHFITKIFRVTEELTNCTVSSCPCTVLLTCGKNPFCKVKTPPYCWLLHAPAPSALPAPAIPISCARPAEFCRPRPHCSAGRFSAKTGLWACCLMVRTEPCAAGGRPEARGDGLTGLSAETTVLFPLGRSRVRSLFFPACSTPFESVRVW